jgi:hypothetical protein
MIPSFAYRLDDPIWPPALYEVRGDDPETGLIIISPAGNPHRVVFVYRDDLWILC